MNKFVKALSVVGLAILLMGQTRFPPQGGGVSLSGTNTWTGVQTFEDESFIVCDNGDSSKCVEFENTGVTTSTTIPVEFSGNGSTGSLDFGGDGGFGWGTTYVSLNYAGSRLLAANNAENLQSPGS